MTKENVEWLETDGFGGYATGSSALTPLRKYHSLLTVAPDSSGSRFTLCNSIEAFLNIDGNRFPLSSLHYRDGTTFPEGDRFVRSFSQSPFPTWEFEFEDARVTFSLFIPRGKRAAFLTWKVQSDMEDWNLIVRPLLSVRNHHALQAENSHAQTNTHHEGSRLEWKLYDRAPSVYSWSTGTFCEEPFWYRGFSYSEEQARGYNSEEDLLSPGTFTWDSSDPAPWLILSATSRILPTDISAEGVARKSRAFYSIESGRRAKLGSSLEQAAESYIIRRGNRTTIIAGYPWFADWGRDTFISLPGLTLATGKFEIARNILISWASTISRGMIPNRFPDGEGEPEYNSVDASLWYIIAVADFYRSYRRLWRWLSLSDQNQLQNAIQEILIGYSQGTRHGIHADKDGLLAAGEAGVQLTWMDAKCGDWVVTPRIGKPVEIQALWINALHSASQFSAEWIDLERRARTSFQERFWNRDKACLYDVVDADHITGKIDDSVRPNQLFAVGGLPLQLVDKAKAALILECAERHLLTPVGIRTLSPEDPQYQGYYSGDQQQRDSAYHQGTAWPWLMGAFIEGWVRVRGSTRQAKREAREKFFNPWMEFTKHYGLNHLPEIADGNAPHSPRGAPFQAWSIAEALRIKMRVL